MSEKLKKIRTLVEFVSFVEKECSGENIIFRGQSEGWAPRPKIARDLKFKRPRDIAERQMFEDFKRESRPFMDRDLDDWHLLAVAQHHGLPTRLLDWTKNPLAALWFAVKDVPKKGKDGYVWAWCFDAARCCDTSVLPSPLDCTETHVYRPGHVHRRLSAQFGWFTVHPFVDGDYQRVGRIRPDEKRWDIEVPPEAFGDIRYQLDRCGVNSSTMFPGLDGLCGQIQWLHSLLKDEEPAIT